MLPDQKTSKRLQKPNERLLKKVVDLHEAGNVVAFADETKKNLTTIVKKVIAKRGSKPKIKVNLNWRVGVYVFVALLLASRQVFVFLGDKIDSSAVKRFLRAFKKFVGKGRVYLCWDNHGSHISRETRYRARKLGIHLVQMPAWSPDLNPVEEIFRQLKAFLANKLFFSVDELKSEIMRFFQQINFKVNFDPADYLS